MLCIAFYNQNQTKPSKVTIHFILQTSKTFVLLNFALTTKVRPIKQKAHSHRPIIFHFDGNVNFGMWHIDAMNRVCCIRIVLQTNMYCQKEKENLMCGETPHQQSHIQAYIPV